MGDIASNLADVERERICSRLVTTFFTHDDRRAILRQTEALHRQAITNPEVALVPGHNAGAIDALVKAGALARRFNFADAAPKDQ